MFRSRRAWLISLDWMRAKDPPLSLGVASIVAHCRSLGLAPSHKSWNCSMLAPDALQQEVLQWLTTSGACEDETAIIGLGAFVWNEHSVQSITKKLKEVGCKAKIVLGGPQVSYVERGSLEKHYPFVDAFVRGHGELPISEMLQGRSATGVHWAGSVDAGQVATAALAEVQSPFLTGVIAPQPFLRWETQRGCPFRCSFCQHAEPGAVASQRNQISAARLAAETQWLCTHRVSDIAVLDPIFNSGSIFVNTLERLRAEGFRGKLALQVRAEMAAKQVDFLPAVDSLQQSTGAKVVLELGLQTSVKTEMQLINRPNNLRLFAAFIAEAKRRGLETDVSLIYGLPRQTVQSFRESLDYVRGLEPTRVRAFPLMLLRGTALYRCRKSLGLREECVDMKGRVAPGIPVVVESPSFSLAQWQEMNAIAEAL